MKIDLLVKERDSYSSKIKELQKIVSKVVVTEHTTPESKIHSPTNSSVGSFKTAASSHQKTVSSKRLVNSFDQIRTTNIFYDWKIDGSVEDEKNDEKKEEKKGKKEEKTVTPIRTATNNYGPKYQWLPKPKSKSVLQAPQVKGECYTCFYFVWISKDQDEYLVMDHRIRGSWIDQNGQRHFLEKSFDDINAQIIKKGEMVSRNDKVLRDVFQKCPSQKIQSKDLKKIKEFLMC
ncbi:hypothetical protein L6452_34849 [Arctium lappa]|uniref:Uncharacterized protein n=1 Tax=Arctium lappa TaxID=4217 RepID=A0ACB8YKW1_ARCLA|nr:hypothetical protein L6452_34849 [Arctium lappa]